MALEAHHADTLAYYCRRGKEDEISGEKGTVPWQQNRT